MAHYGIEASPPVADEAFDLSTIFIGRQQQLDLFEIFLQRWQRRLAQFAPEDVFVTMAPSPSNKLQGLVVLLYGRGGFGKSTLLKQYREIALEMGSEQSGLVVSKLVDWEFAVEGRLSIFQPAVEQEVAATDYYEALCSQLASAFDRPVTDFKHYHTAVQHVEQAKKDVYAQLECLQRDGCFSWLQVMDMNALLWMLRSSNVDDNAVVQQQDVIQVDTLSWLARSHLIGGKGFIKQPKVVEGDNATKFTQEQLDQVRAALHTRLGKGLEDFLHPELPQGLALGRDLSEMASSYPLLICFDSYEEIDEGDGLLRLVMAAAGPRVGWVLAGRANLWAGVKQYGRRQDIEYGYKDLVPSDRGLPVNFNSGDVGALTLSDIQAYFDVICEQTYHELPLARIKKLQAKRILDVTQGVPLAVKIAAGLYVETASVEAITQEVDGKREIVDEMVCRYLLHTKAKTADLLQLYGLALLRRSDNLAALAIALGLSPEHAEVGCSRELSRLYCHYSFLFTQKEQPALHQEVRYFLRLWLFEHRGESEIVAIIKQLIATFTTALAAQEERMGDSTLKERLQDDEWVAAYLDLTEQYFWLQPMEGVRFALPFMIAASVYRQNIHQDVTKLGAFFECAIQQPHKRWWMWATQGLPMISSTDYRYATTVSAGLEALVQLVQDYTPSFPDPVIGCLQELEGTLWWRFAESYRRREPAKALIWYERALTRLSKERELCKVTAEICYEMGRQRFEKNKYKECISLFNRAIELWPEYVAAYTMRGNAYYKQKSYEQAIVDYTQAITRDSLYTEVYNNRGLAYYYQQNYERAIADYTTAITLDAHYVLAYNNRGSAYHYQKEYGRAIADYTEAIALDFKYAFVYNNRGLAYHYQKEYKQAIADYTEAIALNPRYTSAYNNRGNAHYNQEQYKQAIADYTEAIALNAQYARAYSNRGNAYAKLKEYEQGIADYTEAMTLSPQDAVVYYNRGLAHQKLKEYEQAITDYSEAIAREPHNAVTHSNRGMSYLFVYRRSEAKQDFACAHELNTMDVNAAWMAEWAGMGKQRAGIELATRLEEITATVNAQSYEALVCQGVALGLRRKVKDGLERMETAIPLKVEEWDAYFWKGMLMLYYYQRASSCEEAVRIIRHALTLGLPPVLLTPLYSLQEDRPDTFVRYVRPLLIEFAVR